MSVTLEEILPSAEVLEQRERDAARYNESRQEWERQWRLSGRSLARHLVEDVHDHHRRGFAQVIAMVEERKTRGEETVVSADVVRSLRWRVQGLQGHHSLEDASFFPLVKQRFPDRALEVDVLEGDHQRLHPLEDVVLDSDGTHPSDEIRLAALQEFIAFLNDHLNREEMLTVPLMLQHPEYSYWW